MLDRFRLLWLGRFCRLRLLGARALLLLLLGRTLPRRPRARRTRVVAGILVVEISGFREVAAKPPAELQQLPGTEQPQQAPFIERTKIVVADLHAKPLLEGSAKSSPPTDPA
jgi:hypothetical protein